MSAKVKEEMKDPKRRERKETRSRSEIESACAEMYRRDTERRKRLEEQMIKKAEENLPDATQLGGGRRRACRTHPL